MRSITLLGATGSVGTSTLDLIRQGGDGQPLLLAEDVGSQGDGGTDGDDGRDEDGGQSDHGADSIHRTGDYPCLPCLTRPRLRC